jgi:hypothetical protein
VTCSLAFLQPRNGGVGTRWVHGSLGVEAVEAVGEVVQLLGEQVAVAVQRDRGGLVAQGLYVLKAGPRPALRAAAAVRLSFVRQFDRASVRVNA